MTAGIFASHHVCHNLCRAKKHIDEDVYVLFCKRLCSSHLNFTKLSDRSREIYGQIAKVEEKIAEESIKEKTEKNKLEIESKNLRGDKLKAELKNLESETKEAFEIIERFFQQFSENLEKVIKKRENVKSNIDYIIDPSAKSEDASNFLSKKAFVFDLLEKLYTETREFLKKERSYNQNVSNAQNTNVTKPAFDLFKIINEIKTLICRIESAIVQTSDQNKKDIEKETSKSQNTNKTNLKMCNTLLLQIKTYLVSALSLHNEMVYEDRYYAIIIEDISDKIPIDMTIQEINDYMIKSTIKRDQINKTENFKSVLFVLPENSTLTHTTHYKNQESNIFTKEVEKAQQYFAFIFNSKCKLDKNKIKSLKDSLNAADEALVRYMNSRNIETRILKMYEAIFIFIILIFTKDASIKMKTAFVAIEKSVEVKNVIMKFNKFAIKNEFFKHFEYIKKTQEALNNPEIINDKDIFISSIEAAISKVCDQNKDIEVLEEVKKTIVNIIDELKILKSQERLDYDILSDYTELIQGDLLEYVEEIKKAISEVQNALKKYNSHRELKFFRQNQSLEKPSN
ncbi:hypothetical protein EDEG_03531 [Edhazardia aedis USNM 41457]|uniref:Uncharacterized protein n=1 Tax=Edhazardia aedis (strain USNM 41457) TaxID=1003232 RepID=J9D2G1_EDHAE|nr:hypothetical protein EDEG_03531 [Edhazardia aedis USNM 41457]|eukprot:EJW02021.1 hypothetical protein EDEG_03531 [Edhazardia aedis USNM 41457]